MKEKTYRATIHVLFSSCLVQFHKFQFCERITVVDDGNSRDSNWECNRVANDLLPLAQHFQSVVFRDHVGNGIPTRSDHLVLVQKLNGLLDVGFLLL